MLCGCCQCESKSVVSVYGRGCHVSDERGDGACGKTNLKKRVHGVLGDEARGGDDNGVNHGAANKCLLILLAESFVLRQVGGVHSGDKVGGREWSFHVDE